ncbi:MAG: 5-formyltetrahydrofolate cyclo-ligase [Lachnospiraceae bacterium]|nr:5-formyltetrahydrofolate cyclo-ligase [Lachnospiraceae bacterium]
MDKIMLRKYMTEKRNGLTAHEIQSCSEEITKKLLGSIFYKECRNLCLYNAFRNEVSCRFIMKQALSDRKRVFMPVTDESHKTIEFYEVTGDTVWRKGAYGIEEPILESETRILKEKAVILMPGLVFDRKKHRIGYGGGYYDRYLARHTEHITAALCYAFQIIEENLPCEEHDILPDYIITEKEIF